MGFLSRRDFKPDNTKPFNFKTRKERASERPFNCYTDGHGRGRAGPKMDKQALIIGLPLHSPSRGRASLSMVDDPQRKNSLTFTRHRHDNSICGTMGPESLFAGAEITETSFVAATTNDDSTPVYEWRGGRRESLSDKFARHPLSPTSLPDFTVGRSAGRPKNFMQISPCVATCRQLQGCQESELPCLFPRDLEPSFRRPIDKLATLGRMGIFLPRDERKTYARKRNPERAFPPLRFIIFIHERMRVGE